MIAGSREIFHEHPAINTDIGGRKPKTNTHYLSNRIVYSRPKNISTSGRIGNTKGVDIVPFGFELP
jgi:hypothetical protein